DGAHNWFTDGFAFFLVDKLLKPGGLIIFDDLDWTYEESPALKNREELKYMSEEERTTPQIRKVYEILVKSHPSYDDFMEKDGWAYARKTKTTTIPNQLRKEIVCKNIHVGLGAVILNFIRVVTRHANVASARRRLQNSRDVASTYWASNF